MSFLGIWGFGSFVSLITCVITKIILCKVDKNARSVFGKITIKQIFLSFILSYIAMIIMLYEVGEYYDWWNKGFKIQ
jgi:hypothetical protein